MKTHRIVIALFAMLWLAKPAFAHRLDEFLQATTIGLEADRVNLHLRLTPGVDVSAKVIALIDTDGNSVISESEKAAYAERVREDLALRVDGNALTLRLISAAFPTIDAMQGGVGEILLNFTADVPPRAGSRKLTFEDHHQIGISAYLVNALVPRDIALRIAAQNRNYDQSSYELDYTQAVDARPAASGIRAGFWMWLNRTGSVSLVAAFFLHGVRHVLTGYDHLLFVSALVLAANTLWDLVKVVTAFTLAHTLTLTLAAFNLVHLPAVVVEPLISASIVFVALQNVFWPRRALGRSRLAAAFFFGLFHGLGFAGGLLDAMREMPSETMLLALFAFSVGVEAGHQMVVLPLFSILKLARRTQPDAVTRTQLTMAIQRIGSAGISMAGVYYLCTALIGNS